MTSITPVRPRVSDPTLKREEEEKVPSSAGSASHVINIPEDANANDVKSKTNMVKGLFTSALENKMIVFIIVMVIITIGIITYFVVKKGDSKKSGSGQNLFDKFKKGITGKPDSQPAIIPNNNEVPPTAHLDGQPADVQQASKMMQRMQPPPAAHEDNDDSPDHENMMTLSTDQLEKMKQARLAQQVAAQTKTNVPMTEYLRNKAIEPESDDETDDNPASANEQNRLQQSQQMALQQQQAQQQAHQLQMQAQQAQQAQQMQLQMQAQQQAHQMQLQMQAQMQAQQQLQAQQAQQAQQMQAQMQQQQLPPQTPPTIHNPEPIDLDDIKSLINAQSDFTEDETESISVNNAPTDTNQTPAPPAVNIGCKHMLADGRYCKIKVRGGEYCYKHQPV